MQVIALIGLGIILRRESGAVEGFAVRQTGIHRQDRLVLHFVDGSHDRTPALCGAQ